MQRPSHQTKGHWVSLFNLFRSGLQGQIQQRRRKGIYRRFSDFTMVPPSIYEVNLLLAESVLHISGCVVECGVWRGGMCAGLATVLGPSRKYYLLDSFEGLPPAREIDGESALAWQKNTQAPSYWNNCAAPPEFAERAMLLAGIQSFTLVKGWFDQTLPLLSLSEPIALLRLDADWYDSTRICLQYLFDQVVPGGLILIDDYYTWDGCSKAVHDFLSDHSALERIRSLGEVCYLRKAT